MSKIVKVFDDKAQKKIVNLINKLYKQQSHSVFKDYQKSNTLQGNDSEYSKYLNISFFAVKYRMLDMAKKTGKFNYIFNKRFQNTEFVLFTLNFYLQHYKKSVKPNPGICWNIKKKINLMTFRYYINF